MCGLIKGYSLYVILLETRVCTGYTCRVQCSRYDLLSFGSSIVRVCRTSLISSSTVPRTKPLELVPVLPPTPRIHNNGCEVETPNHVFSVSATLFAR